jgi:serine phosphatase RsbU (regulator of sigma subunit)
MDISVCSYNPENNVLQYSGAYNSLYIIRQNNLIEYKADRQPVGVYVKEHPFKLHEIQMNKDDRLYMFSDGYSSQFGGTKNGKLKTSKFKEYLLSVSKLEMSEQKLELENRLINWQGNNEQLDDILVIGVEI